MRPGVASRRSRAGGRGLAAQVAVDGVKQLRAVLFDVDFTLCRPGPELGPEGYVGAGLASSECGLDPALYEGARGGGDR